MLISAACGGGGGPSPEPPPAPVQHGQVNVDGQLRNYRVFMPPTLDRRRPAPLVMVLHGGNNTVEDAVKAMLFDREATAGDFIVAGHIWFASGLGPANGALDATSEIWRFFSSLG